MPTLSAQQARKISEAEAAYASAKRAFEEAKEEREAVRDRYRDRVPLGAVVAAGGLEVKRREQSSGPSFRIAAFLKDHSLTRKMRPFYSDGTPYEVWDVRPSG